MFTIEPINDQIQGRELELNDKLFHQALKLDPVSMERFHVKNPKGDDFDIVYLDNDEDIEPKGVYPAYIKRPFMHDYRVYDEYDRQSLYLDFFNGLDYLAIEELNEYTIAITKVVLNFTDMEVFATDRRLYWFVDKDPRIHIDNELPADIFEGKYFVIQKQFRVGMEDNNFKRLSATYAFHNIFFLQWILQGKNFSDYKYITVPIDSTGGIGALLSSFVRLRDSFSQFGLKFVAPDKDHLGKFSREFMERYFAMEIWDENADNYNTLAVPNVVLLVKIKFYQIQSASIDKSVISNSFKQEMDEYYDAVLGSKKTLGILIRGTDYIATGLSGTRKMATVEQMIPTIRKWIADYGYEKIFLATEDAGVLKQMRDEFGNLMTALAQERVRVEDLKKGQILSDYEKEHNREGYREKLEDTTVNYFYALYLLSLCDGFMCSGQCNGWDTVLSLNDNKFERTHKFSVGINGDPRTQDWEEVGPITAGMFARGAYPTDKVFFMTSRYDLQERVDGEALKLALDETLKAYPYMGYAVVMRGSRLMLAKNPLSFVIKETGEVIEPSSAAGNFHSITFCYLGNTLMTYTDYVAVDGTGLKMVMETLFYHYYCILDKKDYPLPEGVHSGSDGAVSGHDRDAFLETDAIDPAAAMSGAMASNTFALTECPKGGTYLSKLDCRGFCMSVPKDKLMSYARSVKGSPNSVITVFAAKAAQRVHPENTLPVNILFPLSFRKGTKNESSILLQGGMSNYAFKSADLDTKDDEALNTMFRSYLNDYTSEQNIKMLCGVYRGICEGFAKAFVYGALDKIIADSRSKVRPGLETSYLGTLRTGEYGSRIKMKAFHAMQEKAIMIQMIEIGGMFYINWYQGLHGEAYILALRDLMQEAGIENIIVERVE